MSVCSFRDRTAVWADRHRAITSYLKTEKRMYAACAEYLYSHVLELLLGHGIDTPSKNSWFQSISFSVEAAECGLALTTRCLDHRSSFV